VGTEIVAVLPVHGLTDHQLGLSWDVEELVGSVLLADSARAVAGEMNLRLLPPLRLSLAPYHPALTPADPETFHAVLHNLAKGLKAAGVTQLALWSTNPWNHELLEAAVCDLRVEHGLRTYVLTLEATGLSLHPRLGEERAKVQALACHLTGSAPTPEPAAGEPSDIRFRPGNWQHYPPVPELTVERPEQIRVGAVERLAALWREIAAVQSGRSPDKASAAVKAPSPEAFPEVYPAERRAHYLPALTPTETRLWAATNPLVILPLGAIEQHGPHLPLGVDSMIAEAAVLGLIQRCGEAVCLGPTLVYGKSNEHADFPGTLDLGGTVLRRLLKSMIGQMHALGFRKFAVLNTHGGNSAVLLYTLRELQAELDIRVGMLRLPGSGEQSPQETAWGFHAGEWETSVMLSLVPEWVQMDAAISHYPPQAESDGGLKPGTAPAMFGWSIRDLAPEGVLGDATKATAAKGERWFEAALDDLADTIRSL
jgi:creatinine amidohydrolase